MKQTQCSINEHMRTMQETDLETVVAIETQVKKTPWSRGIFVSCLQANNHCIVVEQDNCLHGYGIMMIAADEATILNLCVRTKSQRLGFGRTILKYLINTACSLHADNFFLEVRESNHAAIQLYQTEGFNEIGIRTDYYLDKNGKEDAIIMGLCVFQN